MIERNMNVYRIVQKFGFIKFGEIENTSTFSEYLNI